MLAANAVVPWLSEFGLRKQNVSPDFRVVLDKLQLLWKSSGIFPFHVEESGAGGAEQLDQQCGALLARCHMRATIHFGRGA